MSETKYVTISGNGPIRKNTLLREFSAPIEAVWEMVTSAEKLKHWWVDWRPGGAIEPKEGGRVILDDGSWIDGRITNWNPPHIFAFTWHEHLDDPAGTDWFEEKTKSQLRIDLVSTGEDMTLLTLTQFIHAENAVGGAAGWHQFGEYLAEYIEHGTVIYRAERFDQLKSLYSTSV